MQKRVFMGSTCLRSNTQRIWIPKTSLEGLEVVAVVGAAKKQRASATDQRADDRAAKPEQEELFERTAKD